LASSDSRRTRHRYVKPGRVAPPARPNAPRLQADVADFQRQRSVAPGTKLRLARAIAEDAVLADDLAASLVDSVANLRFHQRVENAQVNQQAAAALKRHHGQTTFSPLGGTITCLGG